MVNLDHKKNVSLLLLSLLLKFPYPVFAKLEKYLIILSDNFSSLVKLYGQFGRKGNPSRKGTCSTYAILLHYHSDTGDGIAEKTLFDGKWVKRYLKTVFSLYMNCLDSSLQGQ